MFNCDQISELILGLNREDYLNIPYRATIAYGDQKAEAIKAAIKNNLINILITDNTTAEKYLMRRLNMNLLITAPYETKCIEELKESGKFEQIIYKPWTENKQPHSSEELAALIKNNNCNCLVVEIDKVQSEIINKFDLSFIGVCRANPVNVDREAAKNKNIPILNAPARNSQAVAELIIGNIISFYRHTIESNLWLKNKNWFKGSEQPYQKFKGNELYGKSVGFVGFGAVAKNTAKLMEPFECNISFYDPFIEECNGYSKVELDDIFRDNDIVSIHLPVTPSTINMIGDQQISLMKKNAVLINSSRADVIVTESLLHALDHNLIQGAIIDVFDNEPPEEIDYRLINHKSVLATPHLAGASFEVATHHSKL